MILMLGGNVEGGWFVRMDGVDWLWGRGGSVEGGFVGLGLGVLGGLLMDLGRGILFIGGL